MLMVRGVITPGSFAKPPGIFDAAGLHHRGGIVDYRRDVRAIKRTAAFSAGSQRSASPMALKIS